MAGRAILVTALCAALTAAACNSGGGDGGGGGGANSAPTFTSANMVGVAENTAGSFYTATAADADGDALTFSISGGADAALFAINAMSGALSFLTPPDFEAPADMGADNVYNLTLSVFDGALSAGLALTVTVSDVGAMAGLRVGSGFSEPLFLLGKGDGTGRVLVLEKGGLVRILDPATGMIAATPFLTVAGLTTNGERGLLGMALAPDFANSRNFYLFVTGANGQIQIRRYQRSAANADVADPVADIIFTAEHADNSNHNGGWIGFGPDNLLYFAIGDGGGGGDPDGNGQNTFTPLGAVLRIDPSSDDFPADDERDYAIPPGNPFANGVGGLAEILHWGLRNPFRASFDRSGNGFFYIGDVGQGAIEEVDLARPQDGGLNFGWDLYEGTQIFTSGAPPFPGGTAAPVTEYSHGGGAMQGATVIGGYVYRGPIAALQGHYVFGDFVNVRLWSVPAAMFVQGTTLPSSAFTDRLADFAPDAGLYTAIASFGEDDDGNLYIVDIGDGEIFMLAENEEEANP